MLHKEENFRPLCFANSFFIAALNYPVDFFRGKSSIYILCKMFGGFLEY